MLQINSSVMLLGVKVDAISLNQLLESIQCCISEKKKSIITYVNIHALNVAYSTPWFRLFLNESLVTFCDGFGVKLAAKLTGQDLTYRYTPPDFIEYIAAIASRFGWRIYFLGAKPGVAGRAADMLLKKFPGLQIETHHGYFEKTNHSEENRQVVAQINRFQPQVLILGFGMPLQEKWIIDNFEELDVQVAFPAGALFDYLSGELPRAPHWMTDNGLEWLGRLMTEPRRLWKRYLVGNPLFFWRVFIHHFLGLPLPE